MVTIPRADISQALLSLIAMLQILIPRISHAIEKRLSQGTSPEDALKEIVAWADETPEANGLGHFLKAALYLKNGQIDEAIKSCHDLRQVWPDADYYSLKGADAVFVGLAEELGMNLITFDSKSLAKHYPGAVVPA